jgi:hypothetical protein
MDGRREGGGRGKKRGEIALSFTSPEKDFFFMM